MPLIITLHNNPYANNANADSTVNDDRYIRNDHISNDDANDYSKNTIGDIDNDIHIS